MIALAAGYQHFADGAPFAEIALRHSSVKEVYFPWVDEPSGRPKLGYEEEDDPAELSAALRRDLERPASATRRKTIPPSFPPPSAATLNGCARRAFVLTFS